MKVVDIPAWIFQQDGDFRKPLTREEVVNYQRSLSEKKEKVRGLRNSEIARGKIQEKISGIPCAFKPVDEMSATNIEWYFKILECQQKLQADAIKELANLPKEACKPL